MIYQLSPQKNLTANSIAAYNHRKMSDLSVRKTPLKSMNPPMYDQPIIPKTDHILLRLNNYLIFHQSRNVNATSGAGAGVIRCDGMPP
ncbi:hypothetical protein GIB67_026702 [Kingdonia uniflora]|uniref:Uncharacterized protein n=1 Tax=Kingdonia uniflora TaxID=39325 RepID=A0A7J7M273_9MAGN|nr:hypothetical protein GIB67_026702 [Kingdonia uniflora]